MNMNEILILTEKDDSSTSYVIDNLLYSKKSFVCISQYTVVEIIKLDLSTSGEVTGILKLTTPSGASVSVSIENFSSFWYRRGHLNLRNSYSVTKKYKSFRREFEVIAEFILSFVSKKNALGSFSFEKYINKLDMLVKASQTGFKIPQTRLSTNLTELTKFIEGKECINKPIRAIKLNEKEQVKLSSTVDVINAKGITNLNLEAPVQLQELLDKKYEVRAFYIKGQIYSLCIFSQSSNKGKIDFRNDYEGIRMVPYSFEPEIEKMIQRFFERIEQDTGSIDIVITKDNNIVFLEVNPTGQYDFVSKICNYNLDAKIAKIISKDENIENNDPNIELVSTAPYNERTKYNGTKSAYVHLYGFELTFIDPFYKPISRC